jgi:hypothetical protein
MTQSQRKKSKLRGAAKSNTIQFNVALIAMLPVFEAFIEAVPQFEQYVPGDIYKMMGLIAVIGNILLRFKTTTALADK